MPTLKDIAQVAEVHVSTVSVVLNDKPTRIKISDKTRSRILDAADDLNYQPNASAKALVTGKSGNLGFILSDQITGGWGNSYFAAQLMGAEDRCKELGYGLSISRYNLSNIEEFVFPKKVSQRNVDGLVLAGQVLPPVLKKFEEFGIPCVAIGMSRISPEVAAQIPTISVNEAGTAREAFIYAHKLGHIKMGMCIAPDSKSRDLASNTKRFINRASGMENCQLIVFESSRQSDWYDGQKAFAQWQSMQKAKRPTVMFGSDQCMIGFLKSLQEAGMKCPEDVSLIANVDTDLCKFVHPALTAMSTDIGEFGKLAVELLVNHLDKGETLGPEQSIMEPKFKIKERQSCSKVAT